MVSLGAIFPFLSALSNAQALLQIPRLQPWLILFQIKTPQQLVSVLAFGFIVAAVLANGLRLLTLHVRVRLAAAIAADISSQLYYTNLCQPYSFHVLQNSSDLIHTVTVDTDRLVNNVLTPFLMFVSNALLAPTIIITLLVIDTKITMMAAMTLGTAYTIIFSTRQRMLERNSKIGARAGQQKVKVVQEGVGGIRDVLLGNSQVFFDRSYRQAETSLRRARSTNSIIAQSPTYIIEAITLSSIALLTLNLGQGDDFRRVVPILGSMALGAKRLLPTLQHMFSALATIQGARASLARILLALRQQADVKLSETLAPPLGLERKLQFDRVWFRYGHETNWVLQDLSLTIKAKTTVGFMGSTGSGKSTTADLILGLLQPVKGRIWVDGLSLENERLGSWQKAIAHVPQQIYLSDATVMENIAFGVPKSQIDLEQVRKAAELAQIENFISELPEEYETSVGERGVRLSGGQRQRIGIARALYKNASVIVFDEATSALDNATEREVMSAIEGLSGELTIIIIAHRLSTIKQCNRIFKLENGQILAQGDYDELIGTSNVFY